MAEEKRQIEVVNVIDPSGYMQKAVDRDIQPPHDPWNSATFYWMQTLAPPKSLHDMIGLALVWFFPSFLTAAGITLFFEPIRYFDLLKYVFLGGLLVAATVAILRFTVRTSAPKAVAWLDLRLFIATAGIILGITLFLK
ncbi:hypothetical protein [Pantanalinema sp. GBBB05]|uniref:hypothetical protein n=1 Tax=Pantanalinema sp. GBBB05 TaxID=2604139 RepID=UPI001DFF7BF3|nr:hypothetical protein [Pantanalinema sp. GBBB05]